MHFFVGVNDLFSAIHAAITDFDYTIIMPKCVT